MAERSLSSATAPLEAGTPTAVVSLHDGEQEKPSGKSGLIGKIVRVGLVVLGSSAVFSAGIIFGFPWWASLVAAVAVTLLAASGYLVYRLWKQRRTAREQAQAAQQRREAVSGSAGNNLEDLKRKWLEVVRSLRQSKLHRISDDALDALPWFAVLGGPGSGKSAMVKSAGAQSSIVSHSGEGPTANCDWWFFDNLVVLDTSGRYVFQPEKSEASGEWLEILNLLKANRRREPINGVIVTLAADALSLMPVDKLKEQAAHIRERLDEISQRLGVKFPVYLTVTKCDLIVGFNEFWSRLPENLLGQAVGEVNSEHLSNSDAIRFFDRAFRGICERVERIRLGQIVDEKHETAAEGMFLFPAELKSLQVPLKSFVDVLFRPSPYRDVPYFRGMFLTSARQTGLPTSRLSRLLGSRHTQGAPAQTARAFFLRDLFATLLPSDRNLSHRTALGRERHHLRWAAGLLAVLALSLLLCVVFTVSFTNNWLALSQLDVKSCMNLDATRASISDSLQPLDACRQNISSLYPGPAWQRVASHLGLTQTHRVAAALKQRFLTAFHVRVVQPLDVRIDRMLARGAGASMVVGSVTQRALLSMRCEQDESCGDLRRANPLSYRVMLSIADSESKGRDLEIERFRRTHESYLLWQTDRAVFAQMRARDIDRIKDWLSRGNLKEESVLESARAQFEPVRASNFWGAKVPLEVDAAYTARAWREGIEPLISGLKEVAADQPDVHESVKKFEANYRDRALHQWGEFLSEFAQPEKVPFPRQMGRELVSILSTAESPYHRVIEAANANLSVILGDAWKADDLPRWAMTLKQYAGLKTKVSAAQKASKLDLKGADGNEEASIYLATYFEAMGQLRGELTTSEKGFKSAQKAFEEGEPGAKSSHPILRATWALEMLRSSIGSPQETDRLFWLLLSRPISLAWRGMLDEAGKYLQQQWEGVLLEVRDLEPGPKGSKIIAFVNQSAGAFLTRQGGRWFSRRLLDQSVPFTEGFVRYLSRLRVDAMNPTAPGSEPPFSIVRNS
jgi:type VI secretion system protein ImpL